MYSKDRINMIMIILMRSKQSLTLQFSVFTEQKKTEERTELEFAPRFILKED